LTEQRFTFDEVAELYDRARPGYPKSLVDDLVTLSGLPAGGRILEIGCGTGQLTASLAERGYRLSCLEPGASLAAVARRRLARFADVEVVTHTFESWPLEPRAFDLVVSAQAFHWVDPALRFAKSADALRAGGSLAVVGNAPVDEPSPARLAVDAAYGAHAPSLAGNPSCWYAEAALIRELFDESQRFEPVTVRCHRWAETYDGERYCDLTRTHSPHRMLPPAQLESLVAEIHRAIERHGGRYQVTYDAHLYLARVRAALAGAP
jgi:SAM-dependent methyltransferase